MSLSAARSAYLRSAAHQPVRWHQWGPDPFETARVEDKPILLDIGAVWCHWCHVMDGESYEDPEIAEILNRDWICIKVDRDERPDVDARYQRAVQAISGQGGWPLTAFLTPDGDVFFGGTYFPPDGKYGRPGFASVLTHLAQLYRAERGKIAEQAAQLRQHLEERLTETKPGSVSAETLGAGADAMARVFDVRYGGFGSQPKFPHPTACEFLLIRAFDTGESWPRDIVDRTLTAMARGGVYDQIGGGFHRYSVDARWIVPHFEKMLYDNAELLKAYCRASSGGRYLSTIEGTADWVMTVMSDTAGGYYASQDADVGLDDDGDYFTWTLEEVRAVVNAGELEVLARHYDIREEGEMHHNPAKNVLWVRDEPSAIARSTGKPVDEVEKLLASGREKLAAARAQREAPYVDTSIYTGWNGMMISAMLGAGAVMDRSDVAAHALATLDRILSEGSDGDGPAVLHALGGSVRGILEDQVQIAAACLDAFEATGVRSYLDRATAMMDCVWSDYWSPDKGLRDRAATEGEGFLTQPVIPIHDSPTPSPNGVAGILLLRLAEHTGAEQWRERATQLVSAIGGLLDELGLHGAALFMAADWLINPATHVVVVAAPDDPARAALLRAARTTYHPRKVVVPLAPGESAPELPPALAAMLDGTTPRAYVCTGTHCAPPTSSPVELRELLST